VKLKRPLKGSETGADVRMVQRALNHWTGKELALVVSGVYNHATRDRMLAFEADLGLKPADGNLDQRSLDKLSPFFDAYGRWRYRTFQVPQPVPPQQQAYDRLLANMKFLSDHTPGYLLGGGHGVDLDKVSAYQPLDCSSSCSKALHMTGLFEHRVAIVSGQFMDWELSGPGKLFTVYANSEHVWIRLHRGRWWRFDTSPHGDGGRGPKLRFIPRSSSGFVARHYPGM
jgi:hypothetical protein